MAQGTLVRVTSYRRSPEWKNAATLNQQGMRTLKELARSYITMTRDLTRVMNRLKAIYRSWAIPCAGQQVYAPRYRAEWLAKISETGVRRRAELYYVQFDTLAALRQGVRRELLAESRKQPATKLLRQIPSIGPIRAALILAIMQTLTVSVPSGSSGPIVAWHSGPTPAGNIASSVAN